MTPQEVYDRVVTHLANQGRRSRTDLGCAYRGPGGRSCAVGCLIPDKEYGFWMEGNMTKLEANLGIHHEWTPKAWVETLKPRTTAPRTKALLQEHRSLLVDLQSVHDRPKDKLELEVCLINVADRHGLSPRVVTEQEWPDQWK